MWPENQRIKKQKKNKNKSIRNENGKLLQPPLSQFKKIDYCSIWLPKKGQKEKKRKKRGETEILELDSILKN